MSYRSPGRSVRNGRPASFSLPPYTKALFRPIIVAVSPLTFTDVGDADDPEHGVHGDGKEPDRRDATLHAMERRRLGCAPLVGTRGAPQGVLRHGGSLAVLALGWSCE